MKKIFTVICCGIVAVLGVLGVRRMTHKNREGI